VGGIEMGFFGTVMAILLALAIRDWIFKPVQQTAEKRRSTDREMYR
jgi:hypothetical protein